MAKVQVDVLFLETGDPVTGVTVSAWVQGTSEVLDSQPTGGDGSCELDVPDDKLGKGARLVVSCDEPASKGSDELRASLPLQLVRLNPKESASVAFHYGRVAAGVSSSGANGWNPLDEASFPVLTDEVDGYGGRSGGGHGARYGSGYDGGAVGGNGGTTAAVDRALRAVLGTRPRASEPQAFVAALQRSFACEQVDGHTVCRWTPRAYAVDSRSDLGAVTGAQGSIHTQARAVLDQALPLLDGLTPLVVDADPEETSGFRAVVRSQLTELVNELGVEGGPRVLRVDDIFISLLGRNERSVEPEKVEGSLGKLRDRFKLSRRRINTIDEERNFTNFILLVDWVVGLRRSWDQHKPFFTRTPGVEAFLGTELLLLSRTLAVAAESVGEVEAALDSVFLGAAERQTVTLKFTKTDVLDDGSLTVDELLTWVHSFTTAEGPRLIQDAGRIGVDVFLETVKVLAALVRASLVGQGGQDPDEVPRGYRSARVQRALGELAGHLETARVQAARAGTPPRDSESSADSGGVASQQRQSAAH